MVQVVNRQHQRDGQRRADDLDGKDIGDQGGIATHLAGQHIGARILWERRRTGWPRRRLCRRTPSSSEPDCHEHRHDQQLEEGRHQTGALRRERRANMQAGANGQQRHAERAPADHVEHL